MNNVISFPVWIIALFVTVMFANGVKHIWAWRKSRNHQPNHHSSLAQLEQWIGHDKQTVTVIVRKVDAKLTVRAITGLIILIAVFGLVLKVLETETAILILAVAPPLANFLI
jgi:hypothetical protein